MSSEKKVKWIRKHSLHSENSRLGFIEAVQEWQLKMSHHCRPKRMSGTLLAELLLDLDCMFNPFMRTYIIYIFLIHYNNFIKRYTHVCCHTKLMLVFVHLVFYKRKNANFVTSFVKYSKC